MIVSVKTDPGRAWANFYGDVYKLKEVGLTLYHGPNGEEMSAIQFSVENRISGNVDIVAGSIDATCIDTLCLDWLKEREVLTLLGEASSLSLPVSDEALRSEASQS